MTKSGAPQGGGLRFGWNPLGCPKTEGPWGLTCSGDDGIVMVITDRRDIMPVRINTRISDRANEWLDRKSWEMAISKSALISLAIEHYIKETDVAHMLPHVMQKLEELEGKNR